jgi:hypothetical protein
MLTVMTLDDDYMNGNDGIFDISITQILIRITLY